MRIRAGRVLVVALVWVAACSGKDKKDKKDKGADKATVQSTAPSSGKAKAGSTPKPIAAAIARLPRDPELLAGFNFRQMRSSEMYKQSPKLFTGVAGKWLDELKKRCGIDAMAQIDLIVVAHKKDAQFILVDGTITKKAIDACVTKSNFKAKTEDGITTLTDPDWEKPLHISWATKTQILTADDRPALAALLARKGSGSGPQAMVDALIGKISTGATAWAIGVVPKDFPAQLIGLKQAPTHFWAHALYQGNAQIKVGARFADDSAAASGKQLFDKLKGSRDQLGGNKELERLVRSIEVRQKGTDVEAHATLTGEQVKAVSSMAGMRAQ
jgi:hypothetical protein